MTTLPPGTPAGGDDRAFTPALAAQIAQVLDHLNDSHPDTVLLLATAAAPASVLRDASLVGVDRDGVELVAQHADGPSLRARLPFAGRPDSLAAVRGEIFGLLVRARAAAGEAIPLTSLEREVARTASLPTFVSTVARVTDLTPSLRQITLRGGLAAYQALAPDQFVYLIVPRDGAGDPRIAPGLRMEDLQRIPEAERPAAAYYTVRRWRPEREELDIWVVLHAHAAGVSAWARWAQPGDRAALWGPRSAFEPPPATAAYLLAADETGLPAVAAILEQLDPAARADVLLEAPSAAHIVDLPGGANVSVSWLFRGDDAPGSGRRLVDAVRQRAPEASGLYVFGAAEAEQIRALRHHLRHERRLPPAQVRLTAYWHRT